MKISALFEKHNLPLPGGAYSLGAVLVGLTLALREFLLPGFQIPILVIFVPAILATSTLGGFRAGLFATLMACVSADYGLIPPLFTWKIPLGNAGMDLASLAVTGIVVASVCAILRKAIQQSEAAKSELSKALKAADQLAKEQRLTEKALRDSLERLERVLDNQTVGAMFWDLNTGAMIDANSTFLELLGYSRTDVEEGRLTWQNLTPPEYLDVSRAEVEKFQATGRVGPYEKEYFCKDGSRKWLLFAGSSLGNNQCVEFCVDISARKRAEAALRESEAKFRGLIDQASDAFFLHDGTGRLLEVNRQACESLGYTREELLRMTMFDIEKNLDRGEAMRVWIESELGSPRTEEGCHHRKDGTEFPVEVRLCAYLFAGKKLQLALARDITERKRAEEALKTQANLLKQSFDAIILWQFDGGIESWNAGAEKLYGFSENEATGRSAHDLLQTAFPKPWSEIQVDLIENGTWEGELRQRTRDGEEVIVSARKQLVRGADGVARVLETNRDITERKQDEQHLRIMRDELAHVGRLSELGQVSAGIAHELNQPLTAMMNYSNVARRLIDTNDASNMEKASEAIAKATDQAQRAGMIIRRMRSFIEKRETHCAIEDINSIVDDAIALALIGAMGDGITTDLRLEADLPPVYVDRLQIQQVLVNLIRNAVDAMADSQQRVLTLSTTRTAVNGVEVAVSDTGPGLPKEVADRIFMPFFTTKPGGMGIGLVISQSIVEAHGGQIVVETEPGHGAVFRFTVPVAVGAGAVP